MFLLNIYLLDLYHDGDLFFYRKFYDALHGLPYSDLLAVQAFNTSSGEPIYGGLMWLIAQTGIEHDYFIAALNSFFSLLLLKFLTDHKSSIFFIFLSYTNYYYIVLLTGAERLKVAFVIITIAALIKSVKFKYFISLLTPLVHTQMIAHILAILAQAATKIRISLKIKKKSIILGLILVVSFPAIIYIVFLTFYDIAVAKLDLYSEGGVNFGSILRLFIIALVGAISLNKKKEFLLAVMVLIMFSALTGSDRFQISALAILVYNLVKQGCTKKYAAIALMAFFSFKSIDFLYNVYVYGHGFAGVRESTKN